MSKRKSDPENPEWTAADFRRAKPAEKVMSAATLANFKNFRKGRGPQKTATKVAISIRLRRETVDHFKASGRGWQARIDDALARIARREAARKRAKA